MSASRPIVNGIDWFEVAPPLRVGKSPAVAMRFRVLAVATLAVAILWAGDAALLALAGKSPIELPVSPALDSTADAMPRAMFQHVVGRGQHLGRFVVAPFVSLARGGDNSSSLDAARGMWRIAWMPLCVTVLARVTVLNITRGESPNVIAGLHFTWHRRPALTSTILLLVSGLIVFSLPLLAVQSAMNIAWLAWPLAIVWPLVMVFTLVFVLFAVGAAVGWPLACTTLAVESSDAFDAVSRSYAYLFQRPWQLASCIVVAAGSLLLGGTMLEYILGATNSVSALVATTSSRMPFWTSAMGLVASGYLLAGATAATVSTYLVLRRSIDGVEVNDVWIEPTKVNLSVTSTHRRQVESESAAEPLARAG